MKPEKCHLIHDLLDDHQGAARREAALLAGGRLLRRRRWKRLATRSLAVAALAVLAAILIRVRSAPHPHEFSGAPPPVPAFDYLTDDQLLALFPNTPVGLATVGHKQVLIFPRPGDKERFVGQF
jgi:hypothetical protein